MIEKFKKNLEHISLLDSEKTVLLAVSGGVDSVVLLNLMNEIPDSKRPQLAIAHINHHLRNKSNSEEKFVKSLAERNSIPFYCYHWQKKDHPDSGIEKAARNVRYEFFEMLMTEHKIPYLMTGHHLDDQTETILMRLTRGASLDQLLGIKSKQFFPLKGDAGYLIRPLLDYSKKDIYQYAEAHQLRYVEDESNQSLDYTRNRFRNEIIPLLKEENLRFNDHINQFRRDLTDLIEISQEPINKAYEETVREEKNQLYLNQKKFQDYSEALQKAVITKILKKLYNQQDEQYKTNYIQLIYDWLFDGEVNSSLDLTAGYHVEKGYLETVFKKKATDISTVSDREIIINRVNHWFQLSETESIGLFEMDSTIEQSKDLEREELLIAEEHLHLPLTVRHRRAGDRMTYQGLEGRKKIKDIFIDDKIPRKEREKTWLVENDKGEIIWLISHKKMSLFTNLETDKLFYNLKYVKK